MFKYAIYSKFEIHVINNYFFYIHEELNFWHTLYLNYPGRDSIVKDS